MNAPEKKRNQGTENTENRNSNVDFSVVRKFGKLERELKEIGIETRSRYGIEPPLGRNRTAIHNRSK